MRLLILTPEFEGGGGGIATYYRTLAPALRELGVVVRVIEGSAYHAGAPTPREVDGFQVETLSRDRLLAWHERFSAYAAAPGLRRHLAAAWAMWEQSGFGETAEIVEAADWGMLFLPPLIDRSRPLVVQGHGSVGQIARHDPVRGEETQDLIARALEGSALRYAQCMQTLSEANALFWGRETGRAVEVIRPAWAPRPTSEASPPSMRGLVVGRIQKWKGPEVVCEALSHLGRAAPDIDWIGRDTTWERAGLSASSHLTSRYPAIWGQRVHPHAPLPSAQIAARQAAAGFNLVPSSWDVFNFSAVEAMASGRPTIVSRGAGASELISDGDNGFLFQAGDAKSLAVCLQRVLSAPPSSLDALARAARSTIERELAPDRIARQRLDAYRAAIAGFDPEVMTPPWLDALCRPASAGASGLAMLDSVGLAPIGRYLAQRIVGRVAQRLRGKEGVQ